MLLRAVEEGKFFPLGSDIEVESNFQLIAGTNRNLFEAVGTATFREDLLRRIDTWSFALPALSNRREDIEPNLDFELKKFEERSGRRVTFSSEAKAAYLKFALSPQAIWRGNFRDLNASVIRMATLAPEGRITLPCVASETARLKHLWTGMVADGGVAQPIDGVLRDAGVIPDSVDNFDRAQLAEVIRTVRRSSTIAEAGRSLFQVSRQGRSQLNDSDRLRKYLARFGIEAKRLVDNQG